MAKTPKTPPHLRPETQKWWRSVVTEFELEGHHLRLLQLAAEAWDQAQVAREVLDDKGQTFLDRFKQPKERPEVGIMQNARIAFARLLRELALDGIDAPEAPRAPRTPDYGRRR